MGTDILIRLERKQDNKWQYTEYEFEYFRNYKIFGILAGIRPVIYDQISYARGLPQDIDKRTLLEEEKDNTTDDTILAEFFKDLHGHSWLLLSEILDWFDTSAEKWWGRKAKLREQRLIDIHGNEDRDYDDDISWFEEMIQECVNHFEENPENLRIVFAFD